MDRMDDWRVNEPGAHRTVYLTCPHCSAEDSTEETDDLTSGDIWKCRSCQKNMLVLSADFSREDDLVFLTIKP